MYIYPNMDLKILNNVNLNNDYDHTIYFASLGMQNAFFASHVKYNLSNQMYQRKERGWIQVNINQNDLWDCTYLMYRNTSYKNKWFYAFILSVDYVNDSVSRINFEIDVIQTWWMECTLDKCFVEREHSSTDNLFENTLEENIDIGKYYNAQVVTNYSFNTTLLVAVCTRFSDIDDPTPNLYNKVFSGLQYYQDTTTNTASLNDFINFIKRKINSGKEDEIVAIYQCPVMMGNPYTSGGYATEDYNFSTYNFVNVDGYVPKNKKLFCYPYNFLSVTDKEGQQNDFKWELWDSNHIGEFLIEGSLIGKPVMSITPKNYRDIALDRENSMTYDNFPICSWTGDSFSIWLAQNKNSILSSVLTSAASIPLGTNQHPQYPLANSGVVGLLRNVASVVGSALDARNLPDRHHGNLSSSVLHIQNESSGFELKQMTIRNEYAKIIDEYFSRFGYACHRIKVPNRNARQNWTYTKTIGCEINGNLPSDDVSKIKSIYDNGITFWNNGNAIGNYGDFTNPVYS